MRSPPVRRLAGALLSAVVAGAVCCGCGGDDEPAASEPPTTTAPSTAPPTTLSPTEEDERALRRLAEDWFEARRAILNGGNDLSSAESYLVNDYLVEFRDRVADLRASGNSIRDDPAGRTKHEVLGVEISSSTATLTECVVDGDHLVAADGTVLDDGVAAYLVETMAIRSEGSWRLSEQEMLQEAVGSDQCIDP